jgi:formate dehydrogenase
VVDALIKKDTPNESRLFAMSTTVIPIADASRMRKARATPKGRAVDPKAAEEIRALLKDEPRRRDLLIEHLHKIQDTSLSLWLPKWAWR